MSLAVEPLVVVQQTDFNAGSGNALQACVATLFGRSLVDVPNFITLACGYRKGIEQFVAPHFDVQIISLTDHDNSMSLVPIGQLVILRGKSPRGSHGHVVVAKCIDSMVFSNVHDPHPDVTFLDGSEPPHWCMFFTPRSAALISSEQQLNDTVISMNKAPFFFRLPRSWFVALLSEWLNMCAVGALDTAMTMHSHRQEYLRCLEEMRSVDINKPCMFHLCGIFFRSERLNFKLQWITRRRVHIEYCQLESTTEEVCQELHLPMLRTLVLYGVHDSSYLLLLRSCADLRSITLHHPSAALLQGLAQCCPLLEEVIIPHAKCGQEQVAAVAIDDVIAFLRRCSCLKNVILRNSFFLSYVNSDFS